MKLVYFVSPYDLLDAKGKSTHAMSEESELMDLYIYVTFLASIFS